MKKYYCLIVIGNVDMVEKTLEKVINGTFMHKNFGKIFISTFESDLTIWEIEEILHKDKRSYFLTKMDGSNFTATVQDMTIQNDLFLDYVTKMTNFDKESKNDILNIEDIIEPTEVDNNIREFIDSFKNNFSKRPIKKVKKEPVPPSLDEILDKISAKGYDNLTDFEKKCLQNYSK